MYEEGISIQDVLERTSYEQILSDCNIIYQDKGTYFLCNSPFHEDKNPSFTLYKDTGHWEDFSGEILRGSLSFLIKKCLNLSLKEYLGVSKQTLMTSLWHKKQETLILLNKEDYNPQDFDVIVEGKIDFGIDVLKSNEDVWLYCKRRRHFSNDFIKYFNIGLARNNTKIYLQKKDQYVEKLIKTDFSNRLCIPIIENNTLASYEGRLIEATSSQKKCVYPSAINGIGGSSCRRLFNIDNLDKTQSLIVCEGIMDLPTIWEYISKNCTCTYGSAIKSKHKEDLSKFNEIIFMFDDDEGGIRGIKEWRKFFTEREFYVASLPNGQDPGESSIEELENALANKETVTKWLHRKHLL